MRSHLQIHAGSLIQSSPQVVDEFVVTEPMGVASCGCEVVQGLEVEQGRQKETAHEAATEHGGLPV
ncbi:hypothetical protein ATKI12_3286 [Kitasatospora sp. Ki12]